MSTQERLLAQHDAALDAALAEAQRIAGDLIVTLSSITGKPSLIAADLDGVQPGARRLAALQEKVIREDTRVRQLTARVTEGAR